MITLKRLKLKATQRSSWITGKPKTHWNTSSVSPLLTTTHGPGSDQRSKRVHDARGPGICPRTGCGKTHLRYFSGRCRHRLSYRELAVLSRKRARSTIGRGRVTSYPETEDLAFQNQVISESRESPRSMLRNQRLCGRFREGFWNGVLPVAVCFRHNRMIGYELPVHASYLRTANFRIARHSTTTPTDTLGVEKAGHLSHLTVENV